MGQMNDNNEKSAPVGQSDDKFYFVDEERLKERLGGGDGPSFSVASLFSSKPKQEEPSNDQPATAKCYVPAPVFTKQSLFILDPNDPRIADVGKFFDVRNSQVSDQEVTARRREIHLIVKNKFKRAERNQDKFNKFGSNKFSKPRPKFKKRKT